MITRETLTARTLPDTLIDFDSTVDSSIGDSNMIRLHPLVVPVVAVGVVVAVFAVTYAFAPLVFIHSEERVSGLIGAIRVAMSSGVSVLSDE